MKTYTQLNLLAVSAAALSLNFSTVQGQVFDAAEALNNRAIAASPRAKEAFPWLMRSTVTKSPSATASYSGTSVAGVTKNRALAASPRALEEFPELARPAQPMKATGDAVAATTIKNRAWAASPRAREEFPWLTRGSFKVTEEPFQIAPLK